jgi:Inner membrane protein YgaP-like, transmembrane domain
MSTERAVRLLAGTLVAISLVLGTLVSPYWLLLATFVSLNLIQSSFTGFCPAEKVLKRLGTT